MDISQIFKHIEGNDGFSNDEVKIKKFKRINKTYMRIGMFIKIISNSNFFLEKLKRELKNEGFVGDEKLLENVVKKHLYTKAYTHISQVEIYNRSQLKVAFKFNINTLTYAIKEALRFFESIEDYDKCHFLKEFRIQVGLQEFSKKIIELDKK